MKKLTFYIFIIILSLLSPLVASELLETKQSPLLNDINAKELVESLHYCRPQNFTYSIQREGKDRAFDNLRKNVKFLTNTLFTLNISNEELTSCPTGLSLNKLYKTTYFPLGKQASCLKIVFLILDTLFKIDRLPIGWASAKTPPLLNKFAQRGWEKPTWKLLQYSTTLNIYFNLKEAAKSARENGHKKLADQLLLADKEYEYAQLRNLRKWEYSFLSPFESPFYRAVGNGDKKALEDLHTLEKLANIPLEGETNLWVLAAKRQHFHLFKVLNGIVEHFCSTNEPIPDALNVTKGVGNFFVEISLHCPNDGIYIIEDLFDFPYFRPHTEFLLNNHMGSKYYLLETFDMSTTPTVPAYEKFLRKTDVNLHRKKFSLLHKALRKKQLRAASLLLKHGASPQKEENDLTPFMMAKGKIDEELALLSAFGISVDAPNTKGATPLMVALKEGDLEKAFSLLKHGASITKQDNKGRKPLNYALKFQKYWDVRKIATETLAYLLNKITPSTKQKFAGEAKQDQ